MHRHFVLRRGLTWGTLRLITTVLDQLHLHKLFKVQVEYDIINRLIPVKRTSQPWFTDNFTYITNWTFVITKQQHTREGEAYLYPLFTYIV